MTQPSSISPEVRAAIDSMMDALSRGDKAGWSEGVVAGVHVEPVPNWPEPGPFVGVDRAWEFFSGLDKVFGEHTPYEVVDAYGSDEQLVIVFRRFARVEGGEPTPIDIFMAATLTDGKFVKMRSFLSADEAQVSF